MGWRLEITDKDGNMISEGGSGGCLYMNLEGIIYDIPRKDDETREIEYDDFGWEKFSVEMLCRVEKRVSNGILGHNAVIAATLLKKECDRNEFWEELNMLESNYDFDFVGFLLKHETLEEVWVHVC